VTKRKWLRRAGLIVGLAGVAVLIVWGLFHAEGGPSRYAIPPLIIYVAPFLIGVLVAWKWPLVGGIALVVIALSWLILFIVIVTTTPTSQSILPLVLSMFVLTIPVTLLPLAAGVLFLLYWRAERASLRREKS